jgi:hypothetical protein
MSAGERASLAPHVTFWRPNFAARARRYSDPRRGRPVWCGTLAVPKAERRDPNPRPGIEIRSPEPHVSVMR